MKKVIKSFENFLITYYTEDYIIYYENKILNKINITIYYFYK